jgi:hypothetical protein
VTADWLDELERLAERVDGERNGRAQALEEIERAADTLLGVIEDVDASWSGSNLGHHAEMYFKDFERPSLRERFDPEWGTVHGVPEGWAARSFEDVSAHVEQRAGERLDDLHRRVDEHVMGMPRTAGRNFRGHGPDHGLAVT